MGKNKDDKFEDIKKQMELYSKAIDTYSKAIDTLYRGDPKSKIDELVHATDRLADISILLRTTSSIVESVIKPLISQLVCLAERVAELKSKLESIEGWIQEVVRIALTKSEKRGGAK